MRLATGTLLCSLLLGAAQAQTTTTTTVTTAPAPAATKPGQTLDVAAQVAAARALAEAARLAGSYNIDDNAWKAAADAAEAAVQTDPSNPDALRLRAQIYSETGFWKQAESAWAAYLKVSPSDAAQARQQAAVAQYNLGYAAYARGDLRNSPPPFERCLVLDPGNVDCALWSGRVYLEGGQFAKAVTFYRQAVQLRPGDKVATYFLGVAQNAGRYGPAATNAFSRAYQNLDSGNKAVALSGFKTATAAAPNFIEAWREQGRLALELGDALSAKAAYDAAVKLPEASDSDRYNQALASEGAQFGLVPVKVFRDAYAKYAAGDKAGAEAGFQAATAANANYGKAWSWLGRVQYERQAYADAAASYAQAVRADPGDKTSAYFLKLSQAGK
ncbi:tetratricopeptide repeat protein [Deinococcus sp.]|uniref:tetratricopeptide repeat protein n=1 Tax=Deinococcus sp. TaxID=47478 RepID=UPI003CC611F9